jgi:hypothetical protein
MELGDGIGRSFATVSKAERDMPRDAILRLNFMVYPVSGEITACPVLLE